MPEDDPTAPGVAGGPTETPVAPPPPWDASQQTASPPPPPGWTAPGGWSAPPPSTPPGGSTPPGAWAPPAAPPPWPGGGAPPPPTAGYGQAQPPNTGYPPPQGGWYQPPPYGYAAPAGAPNESMAIWSLVLGIVSLLCLGLLTGIPAIILATSAKRRIRESSGAKGGGGLATAGLITGIIGTVWSVGFAILIVIGVTLGSSTSSSIDSINLVTPFIR